MPRSLVWLLCLVIALNFIDRSSLSTAAPLIQQEFGLSSTQLGWLLSAFFWVYTPAQVLGGWLVHRFDVRWVLGLGVLLWGAATSLMGLAGGFASIFVLRLLLALGECVTFPSIQLVVSRTAGVAERGKVSSLISSGQGLGPMIGTLFGGLSMAAFGWRAMFVGLGAVTILWIWPWLRASRGKIHDETSNSSLTPIPYRQILRRREFWGMALGMFGGNFAFFFVFIWLPSYLVKAGGLGVGDMSGIVAAIYGVYSLSVVAIGRFADMQTARKVPITRVWKRIMSVGFAGALVSITGCAFVEPRASVWLLGFAGVFFGFLTPALYTITSTLPGPRAVGHWAGALAVAGQLAGVFSPLVTGFLIDLTGKYDAAFLVAGGGILMSFVGWCIVVPSFNTINWDPAPPLAETNLD
jgi:MFS family permease